MDKTMLIPIFIPLIAGFVLMFLPRTIKNLHKAVAVIISILAFIYAIKIFVSDSLAYSFSILQMDGFSIDLLLTANPLRKFILLFAMGFGVLISLYSLKTKSDQKHSSFYYGSLLMAIGGSAGILLSDHLLFLLIFWEIVTASLYILITTGGPECGFAATKTFAMTGFSDGAFLLGIGMVWALSGTFVISEISIAATGALPIIAFLLLMIAAITKAGAMPLHTWLPESGGCASASVMAILPAALDKLLGIYLLVIMIAGNGIFQLKPGALSAILAFIGAATIILAVMVAIVQHDVQRLLSYHAISQVGYMILGIATLTPVGIAGGLFHMLNNSIYKCCLFLCGGAVKQTAGTSDLEELGGLGKKMPFTFVACLIAALSISGVPPFNGFVSKWMIYQGVVKMGAEQTAASTSLWPIWLTAAMFGSALTLASFVKIIHSIFLSRLPSDKTDIKEAPNSMLIPMIVLAALCILFGVFYHIPLNKFIYPALGILPEGPGAASPAWDSATATALMGFGIVLGILIMIISLKKSKFKPVPTWTCGEVQENDSMIVPGTHFYKTISSMDKFRQIYDWQRKGLFDLYTYGAKIGGAFSDFLKWLHSGLLPMYLTWVTVGLLIILFVVCSIW